ncbi:hypothetical protein SAMN05444487_107194 [Marininema mesophilum]|uniref:Uncharacterized protein n=1 Tax=Marininema mesophilum TaxID=1048340 RepID=A0A1H2XFS6_9BACL|nr:hypothetical protein [Marininema mesophilum]SDW91753.1 hypothetical protein SAMN05444487_107194 [Marininema mesophilum]
MGKVVWLEVWRCNRIEKLREEALHGFPWGKLSRFLEEVLEPCLSFLSPRKRFTLDEAVYRLAFEAYVCGIEGCRRGEVECPPERSEVERRRWCNEVFGQEGDELVSRIARDMDLFYHLDEWTSQSVLVFFDEVALRWFLHGIDYGIHLRKRRLL